MADLLNKTGVQKRANKNEKEEKQALLLQFFYTQQNYLYLWKQSFKVRAYPMASTGTRNF